MSNDRCSKCGSTLFHIKTVGDKMMLECYRSANCGWSTEIVFASEDAAELPVAEISASSEEAAE